MQDAPGKPDPTGLWRVLEQMQLPQTAIPVLYAGDTVADMHTVQQAKQQRPDGSWFGVGILPPHVVAKGGAYAQAYAERLKAAGATLVLPSINDLTSEQIKMLIA